MLHPRQSHCGIELGTRSVRSATNDGVINQMNATLQQMRISRTWSAIEEEAALFMDEIQDQLLDINLTFSGDCLFGNDVWSDSFSCVSRMTPSLCSGEAYNQTLKTFP